MSIDPDILAVFLEEASGYLRSLRESQDLELLLRAAHGLKGAASMLGLQALIEITRRIEAALQRGEPVPAQALDQARDLLAELRPNGEDLPVVSPAPEDRSLEEDWDPETARMLRGLFAEEAGDHLEAIGAALLRFDQGVEQSAVEEMLRKAHTLKGSASTVGLSAISEAAHQLEEELVRLRGGSAGPVPELVDRLLAALDVLRSMVAAIESGSSPGPLLQHFSRALAGSLARASAELLPAADGTSWPGLPDPGAQLEERRQEERRFDDQRVRVEVARLDQLMNGVGELVIDRTRVERRVEELKGLARDLGQSRQALRTALADLRGQSGEPAVLRLREIDVEMADAVANLERATADLLEDSEALRRTSRGLQDVLGQVRMMPIHWLHARLQRPLRGMARSQGKQVELMMADESSEMDRSIAEQVSDSLLQLVRNAVAHGIETPEARLAAGKAPVGQIRIVARNQGDLVLLEVEDDGAGIDPEQVRAVLRAGGQLDPARLEAQSDLEVLDHIFNSGFSTRARADQLAGRGVGLSVVRESITALGGTISVSSRPGRGTRFTMQIPMTTAIAQALLFKVGEPVYAIPVGHVVSTLFVQPAELRTEAEGWLVRAGNQWLPLLDLHRILGADPPIPLQRSLLPAASSTGPVAGRAAKERSAPEVVTSARQPVVLLRFAGTCFGVTCTRVIGPREIVLKRLGRLLGGLPLFAGVTISGSSKVQFILDVAFLARLLKSPGGPRPTAAVQSVEVTGGPRLLVADDSRSVREAVAQILRAAGYSVDVAADGWDAWERLQLRTYDLLITDLEMPRLHGHELIIKCRRSADLCELPIVVLTSRTADRNRRAALEKGASAFVAKPLNRRVVLEQIRTLLSGSDRPRRLLPQPE